MPIAINKSELPNTNGRVLLFQRPLTESSRGFWHVRVRKKTGKYFYRSTKTNSYAHAVLFAEKVYHDLLTAERSDIEYTDENKRFFNNWVDKFFETLKHQTIERQRSVQGVFRRYLIDFFGEMRVEQINQAKFNAYVSWRTTVHQHLTDEEARKKKIAKTPSLELIKAEHQMLRQYLLWCKGQGYCDRVHSFSIRNESKLILNQTRRRSKTISKKEFRRIRNVLDKRAHYPLKMAAKDFDKSMWKVSVDEMHTAMLSRSDERGKGNFIVKVKGLEIGLTSMPLHYYHRLVMFYFTQVSYFSLVRPSRELEIRWRDVLLRKVEIDGVDQTMALLLIRKSKKGREKERWLSRDGTRAIVRWRMLSKKFGFGKDNDFVFADPRKPDHPIQAKNIGAAFARVMRLEGLRTDSMGKNITLYTYCRQHGIQMALERHSLHDVARIADASLRTIERHYHNNEIVHNPVKFWSRAGTNKPDMPKDESFGIEWILEETEWERH